MIARTFVVHIDVSLPDRYAGAEAELSLELDKVRVQQAYVDIPDAFVVSWQTMQTLNDDGAVVA